jgi:hypothetical protein
MPLIVTMPVKKTFIREFLSATLAAWLDMVDFHNVSFLKEPLTPSTFALLLL